MLRLFSILSHLVKRYFLVWSFLLEAVKDIRCFFEHIFLLCRPIFKEQCTYFIMGGRRGEVEPQAVRKDACGATRREKRTA